VSRASGVTEEQLQALLDYQHSTLFTEEERTVLRYADAMTATPVHIPANVFQALTAIYQDAQIVELTGALAWENYTARFNHALGIESEGFSEATFCLMPPKGPLEEVQEESQQ
jgi:alkylhydroperoxidase family enzyme